MPPKQFKGEKDNDGPQIVERAKRVPLHLLSVAESSGHRGQDPVRIATLRAEFELGNFQILGWYAGSFQLF